MSSADPFRARWLDDRRLWFRTDDDIVQLDCVTGVRERLQAPPVPEASLTPSASLQRTQFTGCESALVVHNETSREISLWWLRSGGPAKSYGEIGAGEVKRQHTYEGHRWAVRDTNGGLLGVFQAEDHPRRVVITSSLAPITPTRPPPRDHRVFVAPDGSAALELHREKGDRRQIALIESAPANGVEPKRHSIDYPKPGDRIDHWRPRLFLTHPARREVRLRDTLFANPWSIRDVRWSATSDRVTFLYNERGHRVLRLVAIDKSGDVRALIEEQSATFIDYPQKVYCHFLRDESAILWMSERDGHNHLYLFDAKTGALQCQLTRGDFCVRSVEHVDGVRREVTFFASGVRAGEDPYHQHLCRVDFEGANFTRLTTVDADHTVRFAPNREHYLATYSRVDMPPRVDVHRATDGALLHEVARSTLPTDASSSARAPQRFVAKGRDDATDIHGILILPTDFDPGRRYPVVEEIYASPSGQYVPKTFETLERQREIADMGMVLVMIDGMGTNWRSKAFHNVAYQNLEDAGFPDRRRWIEAAAAERPWMDLSRVGIYGGSAGGQAAVRALIDHHDFYRVAVADCGCHDNRIDKMWWNELWLGYPVGEAYARASNIEHASRLCGDLLLIVGELDDNVDPACTYQLAEALRAAERPFELMIVRGAGHGAAETPEGSARRAAFLRRHLLGDEPSMKPFRPG